MVSDDSSLKKMLLEQSCVAFVRIEHTQKTRNLKNGLKCYVIDLQ